MMHGPTNIKLLVYSLVSILRLVVYYLCSLGSLNKDRLVYLRVVGKPVKKVNKVFSFHPHLHDMLS